jgi:hypothetical protein
MVIEFDKTVLKKAKSTFSLRGRIKDCADKKKIDRTTITRAVNNGRGEETTVNGITEYIKENVA